MGSRRLPSWFKVPLGNGERYQSVRRVLASTCLHTVCSSAKCPNAGECWSSGTATFMIMGDVCTRDCRFCAVTSGIPEIIDATEPERLRHAAEVLDLDYVVVTSVTRDDLPDGGASVFASVVNELRKSRKKIRVEVLVPDFQGNTEAIQTIVDAQPDILNHNMETVRELYHIARPQADYMQSLELLTMVSSRIGRMRTKSGVMAGMGETREQLHGLLKDLEKTGTGRLTIGQYLQPSKSHLPVSRFVPPEEFVEIKEEALEIGFNHVVSGPLVRSSYHASKHAENN